MISDYSGNEGASNAETEEGFLSGTKWELMDGTSSSTAEGFGNLSAKMKQVLRQGEGSSKTRSSTGGSHQSSRTVTDPTEI